MPHSRWLAVSAVVLAIAASLAGACIVIAQATSQPPHMRHLTLASLQVSGRTA